MAKSKPEPNPRYPYRPVPGKQPKMKPKGFPTSQLGSAKNSVPYNRGGGSDRKPPRNSGKLCIQIAPFAAYPALATLVHTIIQSFI